MAFCEVSQEQTPGTDAYAGDFGFKVLTAADPAEKTKKLNAEIANGRLAMMAIIGMFFQAGRDRLLCAYCLFQLTTNKKYHKESEKGSTNFVVIPLGVFWVSDVCFLPAIFSAHSMFWLFEIVSTYCATVCYSAMSLVYLHTLTSKMSCRAVPGKSGDKIRLWIWYHSVEACAKTWQIWWVILVLLTKCVVHK